MSFHERGLKVVANLTGMVKTFLPIAFIELILDMCKTLDELKEKQK
ncbi:hypothetical protein CAter10_2522 [Collimonas arenae]|nr:hypothetical protein [Collimonas arenae]AMP00168.1 hypothetical protein CAter10_2522 [Collimonas arenae]